MARFPVLLAVISVSQKLANKYLLSFKMNGTDESVPVPSYIEDVNRATRLHLDRISGWINSANIINRGPTCTFRSVTTCSDQEGKPFAIADAAHRTAAAKGGPRFDSAQTDKERVSVNNGIWLCASCHRKVDGDTYRYSVEDLATLKEQAEERARQMVHGEIIFEMKGKEVALIEQ